MEELLEVVASHVALAVETAAVLIVAFGAVQALARTLAPLISKPTDPKWLKHLWVHFGSWMLLGLQFALAADIVRSAISPDWQQIGQLAAIAVIRTFLSFFLERDLVELSAARKEASRVDAAT
jgi:uncharacterized membrane protein